MRLFFYSSGNGNNKKRLEAAVRKVIPERHIESFQNLDDFRERLRMPVEPDSVAVIMASSQEELRLMQQLRGLLTETYVILVIPEQKKSVLELAHLLLPRFLSQIESNFADLTLVLYKIYVNSQHSLERE